jgi:hypothetical protein
MVQMAVMPLQESNNGTTTTMGKATSATMTITNSFQDHCPLRLALWYVLYAIKSMKRHENSQLI